MSKKTNKNNVICDVISENNVICDVISENNVICDVVEYTSNLDVLNNTKVVLFDKKETETFDNKETEKTEIIEISDLELDNEIFNFENKYVKELNTQTLSFFETKTIFQSFTLSRISDFKYLIEMLVNNIVKIILLYSTKDENLKNELFKINSLKFDKTDLTSLKETLDNYNKNVFNNCVEKTENNTIRINVKNYIDKFESTVNNIVKNCVNLKTKHLFDDYVEKSEKETVRNKSLKFNNLCTFDFLSYNIIRDTYYFEMLCKKVINSKKFSETEKIELMRSCIIDFNSQMLNFHCNYNNRVQRNELKSMFLKHLDTLTKEQITNKFENSILNCFNETVKENYNIDNLVEIITTINKQYVKKDFKEIIK